MRPKALKQLPVCRPGAGSSRHRDNPLVSLEVVKDLDESASACGEENKKLTNCRNEAAGDSLRPRRKSKKSKRTVKVKWRVSAQRRSGDEGDKEGKNEEEEEEEEEEFSFPFWAWNGASRQPSAVRRLEAAALGAAAEHRGRPLLLLCGRATAGGDGGDGGDGGGDFGAIRTNTYLLARHSPVFRRQLRSLRGDRLRLPGVGCCSMRSVVDLLSSAPSGRLLLRFSLRSVVPIMSTLKEFKMLLPLAAGVRFLKSAFVRLRRVDSLDEFFAKALPVLKDVADCQLTELEPLLLAEIRSLFVVWRSRCRAPQLQYRGFVGQRRGAYSPSQHPAFAELPLPMRQKLLAVWCL